MEIKEQGVEIKEPRIEVRELRIGNKVLFGEDIVEIAGISPTGLLDGKQYVTIMLHGGNLMMVNILKIRGVALSEKLLEEYKFEVFRSNGPSEQDWYWVRSGIFNWVYEGRKRFIKNKGKFTEGKEIRQEWESIS